MKKAEYQFHSGETVREGLVRIVGTLIESALARIQQPHTHRAEDVHQVRLTLKWLRAVLWLIRPVISEADFKQETERLKKAAERLAFSRDLTVARQTVGRLLRALPEQQDAAPFKLLQRSFARQAPVQHPAAKREKALQLAASDLQETKRFLQQLRLLSERWAALEPGLREVYRKGRSRMRRALREGGDQDFHDWRTEAKYLYYQLLMLASIRPKRMGKRVKRLRALQNKLGLDHDLIILRHFLLEAPERYGGSWAVEQVMPRLNRQSKELRKQCLALGQMLFRQKPGKFVERLGQHWQEWARSSGQGPPESFAKGSVNGIDSA